MLDELYNAKILSYAGNISCVGTLERPQGSATKIAKLCGSKVSVDIVVDAGLVSEFAQQVKACALGQASASIVAENIIGASLSELSTAQRQLADMLAGKDVEPDGRFEALKYLKPVRDHKSRHASTLLVLDAVLEAANDLHGEPLTEAQSNS